MPANSADSRLFRPDVVVRTTTSSGMTGGVSDASAQTVSVSTAGEVPSTDRSTVRCGLAPAEWRGMCFSNRHCGPATETVLGEH